MIIAKKDILNQYGYLFWWVKQKDNLSDEAIVETLRCYGDEEQVKALFNWLGTKNVAEIFRKQLQQKRINYPERTRHFFTLLFERYVPTGNFGEVILRGLRAVSRYARKTPFGKIYWSDAVLTEIVLRNVKIIKHLI